MEQQAMASQSRGMRGDGRGGDLELAGDLAEGRASHQAVEDRHEQLGAFEPVADPEGLIAEAAPAV
jgi:hypothetical protein